MQRIAQRRRVTDRTEDLDEQDRDPQPSTLLIGRAADPAEAAADRFADGLLHDLDARPTALQRAHAGADELGGSLAPADVEARIRRASGGSALPEHLRRTAEARSGRDLSGVRVHRGAAAADLSRSLQATAFTVGSDVFLGADAPGPGTRAGDALLGHEVGHVVQQGGGALSRKIHRRAALTPLQLPPRPVVRRLFGKKKTSGAEKVKAAAQKSSSSRVMTMADLQKQLTLLEGALKKLLKSHSAGNKDTQSAAYMLRTAAERILDGLPDQQSKASKMLGRTYPAQVKRLQRIIDESQLIWDEHLVEMTKRKAGNIYLESGRKAADDAGGMNKLTAGGRSAGFRDLGPRPDTLDPADPADKAAAKLASKQASYDKIAALRAEGARLGLSAGETAAIIAFSVEDYRYINPATANSTDWMIGANPAADKIDKPNKSPEEMKKLGESLDQAGVTARARLDERNRELAELKDQGALHAGMAVQGLLKLPPWKGKLYRGEVLNKDVFEQRFTSVAGGKRLRAKDPVMRRPTISSASKDVTIARAFWFIAAPKVPPPTVNLLYEMDATNGRDIEKISANSHEKEVATLPGAEFAITEAQQMDTYVLVKCRQRK